VPAEGGWPVPADGEGPELGTLTAEEPGDWRRAEGNPDDGALVVVEHAATLIAMLSRTAIASAGRVGPDLLAQRMAVMARVDAAPRWSPVLASGEAHQLDARAIGIGDEDDLDAVG